MIANKTGSENVSVNNKKINYNEIKEIKKQKQQKKLEKKNQIKNLKEENKKS